MRHDLTITCKTKKTECVQFWIHVIVGHSPEPANMEGLPIISSVYKSIWSTLGWVFAFLSTNTLVGRVPIHSYTGQRNKSMDLL